MKFYRMPHKSSDNVGVSGKRYQRPWTIVTANNTQPFSVAFCHVKMCTRKSNGQIAENEQVMFLVRCQEPEHTIADPGVRVVDLSDGQ